MNENEVFVIGLHSVGFHSKLTSAL